MGHGREFSSPILLYTSSHTFRLSPNHVGTSTIHPFCVGKQNILMTLNLKSRFVLKHTKVNAIYRHNIWEGTLLKCFSFLLKILMT